MNKKETIKEIYNLLNIGKIIKTSNGYNPITLYLSSDLKFIMCCKYGLTAEKNTLKGLTILINDKLDKNMSISYKIIKSIYE